MGYQGRFVGDGYRVQASWLGRPDTERYGTMPASKRRKVAVSYFDAIAPLQQEAASQSSTRSAPAMPDTAAACRLEAKKSEPCIGISASKTVPPDAWDIGDGDCGPLVRVQHLGGQTTGAYRLVWPSGVSRVLKSGTHSAHEVLAAFVMAAVLQATDAEVVVPRYICAQDPLWGMRGLQVAQATPAPRTDVVPSHGAHVETLPLGLRQEDPSHEDALRLLRRLWRYGQAIEMPFVDAPKLSTVRRTLEHAPLDVFFQAGMIAAVDAVLGNRDRFWDHDPRQSYDDDLDNLLVRMGPGKLPRALLPIDTDLNPVIDGLLKVKVSLRLLSGRLKTLSLQDVVTEIMQHPLKVSAVAQNKVVAFLCAGKAPMGAAQASQRGLVAGFQTLARFGAPGVLAGFVAKAGLEKSLPPQDPKRQALIKGLAFLVEVCGAAPKS